MPEHLLTIGEVATRSGVSRKALRLYEARGIVSKNELDQANSNLVSARKAEESAAAHLAMLREGFRTEEVEAARAGVRQAQAELELAELDLAHCKLFAPLAGRVLTKSREPGEVVQAGQTILRVARQDGRDAVFDVPGQVLRSAPSDPLITVTLTDDPKVKATGRVREVSPQADPVTRTFEVKVGLTDAPEAMRLGSTVVGRMQLDATPTIELPAAALTEFDRRPAVWVVDAASLTVSPRTVEVLRHNPATVAIASGLEPGEIVVTAGTQALHPGQKTRLLESAR